MAATPTDLCLVPAGPPPAGRQINFDDPTSLAPVKMTVISILVLWSIVFTAGRFYVNLRKLCLGDYLALIALLIAITILGLFASETKLDRHIWDTPACYFDGMFAKMIFFPALLFNSGSFLAKASIFLLFHQIFTIQRTMRYAIWFGQVVNFLLYGAGIAVAIYYETPRIGEHWDAILDGRTLIPLKWWQAQSALIIVLDLYIFILPLPSVWKLKIPIRRRVPVLAVFSLALMGIGASIASFVQRIYVGTSVDQTWISSILALCSAVELNVAIIVSSGPGFASFTRSHIPSLPSVAGSFFSMGSKVRDSEATLAESDDNDANLEKHSDYAHSDKAPSSSMADDASLDHSLRYYGLSDATVLKSGAALEEGNTGIMRTIEVDQQVKTKPLRL